MYYTYGVEYYNGNKDVITVYADTENEALEKLSSYKVSKGELHYYWLKSVNATGTEKYIKKDNNALGLMIALCGAKLGTEQTKQYGQNRNYLNCLKDNVTMNLIRN